MEAVAHQKYIRVSPKKLKRLATPLKGKSVAEVENILRFHPSTSSIHLFKAVHSAASNLKNKVGPDTPPPEKLYVTDIKIDEGPTYKRIKPRARGHADIMCRRTSHITVIVSG